MGENKNTTLDPMCIDMLKEVGNICSGNATVALSQVLNQRIELKIPDLKLIKANSVFSKLNHSQEILVGVNIQLLGNLSGNIVLMFPEKSAYSLVDAVSQYRSELGNATEYGVSSLKEVGNIVISAYLATLSTFTKQVILHSTPSLICGTLETIFNVAFHGFKNVAHEIILIETFFDIKENSIKGSFFLLFDPKTIKRLLEDTRKYWESDKKTN
ncbi:MAG: chemotaxis protein CheC [Candidatus Omnitrophica bacterium]|nr:chemotaxis protein CheC [Candidatus Omnitrophota bacterium]MBU4477920.1 chemotaxis protein CheC [Candidatus Omnitrophota bacterium]MCG2703852.1 chemotaxis protein CheC [Candidatus Omnitrophota bacterium]